MRLKSVVDGKQVNIPVLHLVWLRVTKQVRASQLLVFGLNFRGVDKY